MSIFEVREWWSAEAGRDEEFDVRSLTFLPEEFLVLGSIQGVLRVYKPRQGTFKVEDMLHEVQMDPILQVEAGNFSPSAKTVAVLHPRKLSFYAVTLMELKLVYEHRLQRNAFNFAFGPFGSPSGQGRDFVCIQSSDGALGFYEYDSYSFAVQLPGFLVPGPITYSPGSDYFLVCNANMQVECYRYGRLRDAFHRYQQGQEATFASEWQTNIGEYAQDIKALEESVILGEHSVFAVDSNGLLRTQKKMDYTPSCFAPYMLRGERMVLIGSFTQHLLLYRGNTLAWAAKLPHVPIAIKVLDLSTQGLIVTLSETGNIDIMYLGTTIPPYQMVGSAKALDYSEMDRDYKRILAQLSSTAEVAQRQEPTEKLLISVVVPSHPGRDFQYIEDHIADDQGAIITTVRVLLKFSGGRAEQVRVLAQCPPNIACVDSPVVLDSVGGATPLQFQMSFLAKRDTPPVGLDVTLTASYEVLTSEKRDLRVVKAKFRLPLLQAAAPTPPSAQADFKITLATATQSPSLPDLFPEFDLAGGNALSFTYYDGSSITIISGKSGDRFRIQGSHFHALLLGAEELSRRLQAVGQMTVYDEALPLQDVFSLIDEHFNLRKTIREAEAALAELTQQYIVVQKRLLVRFKDKNPAPLNNLDFLLQILNTKILVLAEEVETNKMTQINCGYRLSAAIALTHLLIKARFQLNEGNTEALQAHLTAQVQDCEPGWEELVNSAMTQLLRTTLAKNAKESAASIAPMSFPQSTAKLKKHITIVCDRLAKGGRLVA